MGLFRFSPNAFSCGRRRRAGPGGDLDANCLIGMEGVGYLRRLFLYSGREIVSCQWRRSRPFISTFFYSPECGSSCTRRYYHAGTSVCMGMAKSTTCPKRRRRKWNRHTLIAYIATFSQAMHTSSTSFFPFRPLECLPSSSSDAFSYCIPTGKGKGRGLLFLHPLALLPPPPFRSYV